MANVFITPDQLRGASLRLTGGDASHLIRVLRLKAGDHFHALDGSGREYLARVVSTDGDQLFAEIEATASRQTEPHLRLTLGQALPKGDKLEQVIRKGTELGFAAFWPLLTERCVALPSGERAQDRLGRWQRIAAEAAKQSGRAMVPPVEPLRTWAEVRTSFADFDLVLLPWEGETQMTLKAALAGVVKPSSILVLIGPEGGLSQEEAALARKSGAVSLTLGPRILRTETAGLVIGSALFYHYDELGS